MAIKAPITPSVISWARETAKLTLEEAARKIGRPPADIEAWEDGSLQPSMPQARKAAQIYKRPLAVFYLPEPPKGWQVLRDFRTLPVDEPREYSPELTFMIRETVARQEWMREFLIEDGQEPLPFVGSDSPSSDPEQLADSIRQTLGVTIEELRSCQNRDEALNLWIYKAEQIGVFVFRDSSVASIEARGFVVSDEYAPFVYLNSGDAKVAQIFTLVHELVHLWINEPGVSNLEARGAVVDESTAAIETFCNRVSGFVVLEPSAFERQWKSRDKSKTIDETIENIASYFRVSREAVARRLLDNGVMSQKKYLSLRDQYREEWLAYREKEKEKQRKSEGGPSYYRILLNKNGKAYSRTILSAYYSGAVSGRETSSLLNVKLNNLPKLAAEAAIFSGVHRGEVSP